MQRCAKVLQIDTNVPYNPEDIRIWKKETEPSKKKIKGYKMIFIANIVSGTIVQKTETSA